MSQASYNYTVTRAARMALALKREWTREHFHMAAHDLGQLTTRADILSAPVVTVETLPDFGPWARAWVNGTVSVHPAYEAIRVIKVPGIRTRRLVEHQFR